MTARRLAAVDAQTYWMSAKIPSDQFLVYGFDGVPKDLGATLDALRRRANGCAPLRLRVRDRGRMRYPEWVSADVGADRFIVHAPTDPSWPGCLAAVAALGYRQLDARRRPWRMHLFPGVDGPCGLRAGTVVVLQIAHALADGVRSSALAAWLLGRADPIEAVPAVPPWATAALPWRAYRAARAHRRLVRDTIAGAVPAPAPARPALRSNTRPAGARRIATLVRPRSALTGPTVTVVVLAAVAEALAAHLRTLGDDPAQLGAEVPLAKTGARQAHNHFGNVAVGLYPELGRDERMARIAAELADRRRRAAHPAMRAADRAAAAVPAALLRWGVTQFDPDLRSETVTGNTVVSSVHRGAADLRLGGAPVVFTAGYPALSPMMGLTHGVHGIGDTVAISVHAAESAIGDFDAYVEELAAALDR